MGSWPHIIRSCCLLLILFVLVLVLLRRERTTFTVGTTTRAHQNSKTRRNTKRRQECESSIISARDKSVSISHTSLIQEELIGLSCQNQLWPALTSTKSNPYVCGQWDFAGRMILLIQGKALHIHLRMFDCLCFDSLLPCPCTDMLL